MTQPYNVFISWSGDRSRVVAQTLREWLPRVVQAAKPWMSDADIQKGSRGLSELTKALSSMRVGITCLSPDNLDSPWLHFEAGALSKAIDDSSRLCTYLLDGLNPEDVKPPLGMFQATRATQEDTRKLIKTINLSVADEPLRGEDLDAVFDAMWPSLETTIKSLPALNPMRQVRRSTDDMVAEILEIVRADANRKRSEAEQLTVALGMARAEAERLMRASSIVTITGITPAQVKDIKATVQERHKFLGELVARANRWELVGDELRLLFSTDSRAFADLLTARDPLKRLTAIASEALEMPVRIQVGVEGA